MNEIYIWCALIAVTVVVYVKLVTTDCTIVTITLKRTTGELVQLKMTMQCLNILLEKGVFGREGKVYVERED